MQQQQHDKTLVFNVRETTANRSSAADRQPTGLMSGKRGHDHRNSSIVTNSRWTKHIQDAARSLPMKKVDGTKKSLNHTRTRTVLLYEWFM